MVDKRRARIGQKGGNLTPAEAQKKLAIPVYAMLQKDVVPIFPGTSLAACSSHVGLFVVPGSKCRSLSNGMMAIFPVWINAKQYNTAVVPVLTDPRFDPTQPVFQSFSANNNTHLMVQAIGEALAQSFHDAGYGPLPV
jgi:hypothetical protein